MKLEKLSIVLALISLFLSLSLVLGAFYAYAQARALLKSAKVPLEEIKERIMELEKGLEFQVPVEAQVRLPLSYDLTEGKIEVVSEENAMTVLEFPIKTNVKVKVKPEDLGIDVSSIISFIEEVERSIDALP